MHSSLGRFREQNPLLLYQAGAEALHLVQQDKCCHRNSHRCELALSETQRALLDQLHQARSVWVLAGEER